MRMCENGLKTEAQGHENDSKIKTQKCENNLSSEIR